MTLLSINHGAKGVVMWTWPTSAELAGVTSRFAKVVTDIGAKFWLGANGQRLEVRGAPSGSVDAVAWLVGQRMLVSVVNVGGPITGRVTVILPDGVRLEKVPQVAWGNAPWLPRGGNTLFETRIEAMECTLMDFDVVGGALNEPASGDLTATG